ASFSVDGVFYGQRGDRLWARVKVEIWTVGIIDFSHTAAVITDDLSPSDQLVEGQILFDHNL
ncbi:hypothetical protein PQ669_30720, partial [Escherichia coli]|uniref:hypothetical protein n=1 Tax=Escherichia coli TaxID=562 RepID=UPI003B9BFF49